MISIKNIEVLTILLEVRHDPVLIKIIAWIENKYPDCMIVTSSFRFGDSGVHGQIPCRGLDLRSSAFKHPEWVTNDINKHWEYDPRRPHKNVAIYHDVGQGIHMHIQSHSRTQRRYVL